ncbi:MAG: SDR family oxidoreductase [Chloroflexota bacterium]
MSDAEDVAYLKQAALDRFGQVDILVNNAGVGKYGPLNTLSVEDYDWMMNINMRSSFLLHPCFLTGSAGARIGLDCVRCFGGRFEGAAE